MESQIGNGRTFCDVHQAYGVAQLRRNPNFSERDIIANSQIEGDVLPCGKRVDFIGIEWNFHIWSEHKKETLWTGLEPNFEMRDEFQIDGIDYHFLRTRSKFNVVERKLGFWLDRKTFCECEITDKSETEADSVFYRSVCNFAREEVRVVYAEVESGGKAFFLNFLRDASRRE